MTLTQVNIECDRCSREYSLQTGDKEHAIDVFKSLGWFFMHSGKTYCPKCRRVHTAKGRKLKK